MNTPLELENAIHRELIGQKLDSALLTLRAVSDGLDPFVAAGIGMFCVRFCQALSGSERPSERMNIARFRRIHDLVKSYLICDPLGYDEAVRTRYAETNPVFTFLRIFASQASFAPELLGHFARSKILFSECPQRLVGVANTPNFDFNACFFRSNRSNVEDYIKVCYVAFAAAASENQLGFGPSYFDVARNSGVVIPSIRVVNSVLSSISANSSKFQRLYREKRRRDRVYAAYDYNPLLRYPLIRPWKEGRSWNRAIAPLPALVAHRACTGVYYQMREDYGVAFTEYFGSLLENYTGIILNSCLNPHIKLFSEKDVRQKYPASQGKCPDWVVLEGDTAVLFECKATNFRPDALATGQEDAVDLSLRQVKKGLKQLHQFVEACKSNHLGLSAFSGCTKFHPIIVTFEPLHLINSTFFREHIDGSVADDIPQILPWHILDVGQLERFQPHAQAGQKFDSLFSAMNVQSFHDAMGQVENLTGLNYRDSFLCEREMEILRELGASDEKVAEVLAEDSYRMSQKSQS